jgi:hypothetical protein
MEVSGQLHTLAALILGRRPHHPLDRRMGESQNQSKKGSEEKNAMFQLEIKP